MALKSVGSMVRCILVALAVAWTVGCEDSEKIEQVEQGVRDLTNQNPEIESETSPDEPEAPPAGDPPADDGGDAGGDETGGGDDGAGGGDDAGWRGEKERIGLPGGSSGEVVFETRGIQPQSGRNTDGGWEYIFLTLRGDGFDRVLLYQVGGGRDAIRYLVDGPNPARNNNASNDNLPNPVTWSVSWDGENITFRKDGRSMGTHTFRGRPTRAVLGGYDGSGRDFRGEWRLVSVR